MADPARVLRLTTRARPVTLHNTLHQRRGYHVVYRHGEMNRCPGCGRRAWHVGRTMAECANERCGCALPIAGGDS